MNLVLDANRYTDAANRDLATASQLRRATAIVLPVIVLGEVRYGFTYGTRAARNEATRVRFLADPLVSVLPVDTATTHVYAQLMAQLRVQGTPIPVNDVWIAALAVQHGLTLYTRDRHFDRLPQVSRV